MLVYYVTASITPHHITSLILPHDNIQRLPTHSRPMLQSTQLGQNRQQTRIQTFHPQLLPHPDFLALVRENLA